MGFKHRGLNIVELKSGTPKKIQRVMNVEKKIVCSRSILIFLGLTCDLFLSKCIPIVKSKLNYRTAKG